MSQLKYNSIEFKTKRKQEYCFVEANNLETTGSVHDGFNVVNLKKTPQKLTKDLSDCRMRLEAHLMFASELIDEQIAIPELDYDKYFETFAHQNDNRFDGVEVTKVQFIPNKEGELHGVKIFGKKVTQKTDKPYTNNISTPVIPLNKESDNYYKLVSILDAQVNDTIIAISNYLDKAKAVQSSQLKVAI